jgi:hypothetical protein
VATFDQNLCNFSLSCIPQLGTGQRVAALSDRLMYRLQYRNFGAPCPLDSSPGPCAGLTVNHTVDVGGDHAGIRWYILKLDLGADNMSVAQQGTYAPDALHRWMGSAAMDQDGNLAVGFSASSGSAYPSIRYAGRLATDPDGTLRQGERVLQAGGGAQTGSDRWGDYSMLAVDPVDGCSFWYTREYYAASSRNGWQTRVERFAFPSCLGLPTDADLALEKSDAPDPVARGSALTYTLTVTNNAPSMRPASC